MSTLLLTPNLDDAVLDMANFFKTVNNLPRQAASFFSVDAQTQTDVNSVFRTIHDYF